MTKNVCKDEMKVSRFRFIVKDASVFYVSQWTNSQTFFIVYRLVATLYMLAWLIYTLIDGSETLYDYIWYFTNWQVILINAYLFFSFFVALSGLTKMKTSSGFLNVEETRWYHKVAFFFHSVAFNASFSVVVLFWALLASTSEDPLDSPTNIHIHGVTLLVMIIDLFVSKTPVYLLHFPYTMVLGLIYVLYTYILFVAGVTDAVYGFLDWRENPSGAVGMGIGFAVLGALIGQILLWSLHHLRKWLHKKCCKAPSSVRNEYGMERKGAYVNEAYKRNSLAMA